MNVYPGIRETNEFKKLQRATFLTKADYPRSVRISEPTKNQISTIIAYHFGFSPRSYVKLGRNTFHGVFRIQLPDKTVILRMNTLSKLFTELSLHTDIWIYSSLKKTEIPALRVYAVNTRRNIVPWDYEIIEDAGKHSFFDLTHKKGLELSEFKRLGQYIAKVHTISIQGWGPIGADYVRNGRAKGVYPTWRAFITKNLKEHVRILTNAKLITRKEGTLCTSVFPSVFPVCDSRLVHGDVANHNVFPHGNNIVCIDWEDALAGDPLYDVAYFSTGAYKNPEWYTYFLKGYTAHSTLPADFCMKYWLYFLRISIAKAVVRLKESKDTISPDSLSARRIRYALRNISEL